MALKSHIPELWIFQRNLWKGDAAFANGAGAPTDGVTGAGTSKKGSAYLRTSNDKLYINVGTKAIPRWQLIN